MNAAKATIDRRVRKTEEFRAAEQAVWDRYGLTPRERMVEAGGTLVRVNEVGEGPPILFVHGSGGSGAYWSPLVEHLQGHFHCLLIDRPGWANTAPIDYSRTGFGTIGGPARRRPRSPGDRSRSRHRRFHRRPIRAAAGHRQAGAR